MCTPAAGWDSLVVNLADVAVLLHSESDGSALRPENAAGALVDMKHGARRVFFPAGLGRDALGGSVTYTFDSASFTGVGAWEIPITLRADDRITAVEFILTGATGGSKTLKLEQQVATTGTLIDVVSTTSTTSAARQSEEVAGLTHTVIDASSYRAVMTSAAAGDKFFGVVITCDRP